MSRNTIDFGIDLGTTNSTIAVFNGNETEVFENTEGAKCTPSAVWIDAKGRLFVGRRAKERLETDAGNVFNEFKLRMGSTDTYRFAASGRVMTPEELSAEVLKSLRADVQQRTGEEIVGAVVTIPAAFGLPQCQATRRAAQLAGLSVSPLLQEPVAAAMAYGFQGVGDRAFWMVFDMGGGTFDAAIVTVRDGMIYVVNHGGDPHLGGKLIDWEIVERLLVPALTSRFNLSGFERSNPRWSAAFAKLKLHAEQAKIRLSRDADCDIVIDPLCQDDAGEWVSCEYELKVADVEGLIEPYVERAVNISRRILADKELDVRAIDKILLVGGPTLTPMLRNMLVDRLGISLEYAIDPLTVVARGAAVFARTQRIERMTLPQTDAEPYGLSLEYKPIDADPEPLVGGKVLALEGRLLSGYTIEFIEPVSQWRSGKIDLTPAGTFRTALHAVRGRANDFLVELRDATGLLKPLEPDRLSYTIGASMASDTIPLTHSVGVALANNEMEMLLKKGTPLPAKCRKAFRTISALKKGHSGTLMLIPVMEGENIQHAERNREAGTLMVTGAQVTRDVPAGSEVVVTLEIDESRLVRARAFLPNANEEFETLLELRQVSVDPAQLAHEIEREKGRLGNIHFTLSRVENEQAREVLRRIEGEQVLHHLETSLAAAVGGEPDAADSCQARLAELQNTLDDLEALLAWPSLRAEAERGLHAAQEVVEKRGRPDDRRILKPLESETRAAIADQQPEVLRRKVDELNRLRAKILMDSSDFWVKCLANLKERVGSMSEPLLARQLIDQGDYAVQVSDFSTLQSIVRQLLGLLPPDERYVEGVPSTLMPIR
ncbi:MAG: Hsp70 family protein [Armatimonadota bacterium]